MNKEIDFIKIKKRFDDEQFGNGRRAEIRRAKFEDLDVMPAFYELIPSEHHLEQWKRVIFFFPYTKHKADTDETLGQF